MAPAWLNVGWLSVLVCALSGCRSTLPQVEPPKQREMLAIPPLGDARYDTPSYPDRALTRNEKNRRLYEEPSGIMPANRTGFGAGPGGLR